MTENDRKKVLLGLASLCAGGFLLVLALVVSGHTAGFDDPIREAFYALRSEGLTQVLIVLTNTANKFFIIAVCLLLLILPETRLHFGVPLSAGALGTIILNSCIKYMVMRERPAVLHLVTEDGYSFPSGHSVTSMFFYGMALWLVWHYVNRPGQDGTLAGAAAPERGTLGSRPLYYEKRTAILLTVLLLIPMICVGLTRIYLGVHFPTDVLGGWCLGGFAIFLEAAIICALEHRHASGAS